MLGRKTPDSSCKVTNRAPAPKSFHHVHISSNSSNNQKRESGQFVYCHLTNKSVQSCFKFKSSNRNDKQSFIKSKFICLKKSHDTASCQSDGCTICGKRHHEVSKQHSYQFSNQFSNESFNQ